MFDGALALALGAGMLAALNPCGFALLPAYLTLLVSGDDPTRTVAVARAVKMTAVMTAGFAMVFAVFGLVISPLASSVQQYLPWFTIVVGVVLAGIGLWLLAGRSLGVPRIGSRGGAPITRSTRSMFGFGVSYAIASLSCTIAPFLAVVVSAFRADSIVAGSVLFLAYAAGMGLVVGTAAVAVALARKSVVGRMRSAGRFVPRIGGILLALIGVYVAYYGAWEIRVLNGADAQDPVIDVAADIQQWLSNTVDSIGALGFVIALGGVVAVAAAAGVRARLTSRKASQPEQAEDTVSG